MSQMSQISVCVGDMDPGQNPCTPVVHTKTAGKWMFIGIDSWPDVTICSQEVSTLVTLVVWKSLLFVCRISNFLLLGFNPPLRWWSKKRPMNSWDRYLVVLLFYPNDVGICSHIMNRMFDDGNLGWNLWWVIYLPSSKKSLMEITVKKWWKPQGFLLDELGWPLWEPGGRLGRPVCKSELRIWQGENNQRMCQNHPKSIIVLNLEILDIRCFSFSLVQSLNNPWIHRMFFGRSKSSDREGTARGWRPPWILDHMSCFFLGCRPGIQGKGWQDGPSRKSLWHRFSEWDEGKICAIGLHVIVKTVISCTSIFPETYAIVHRKAPIGTDFGHFQGSWRPWWNTGVKNVSRCILAMCAISGLRWALLNRPYQYFHQPDSRHWQPIWCQLTAP